MAIGEINQVSEIINLAEEFIINIEEETIVVGSGDTITMNFIEDTIEVLTPLEIITVVPKEEVLQFNFSEVIVSGGGGSIVDNTISVDTITAETIIDFHSTKFYSSLRWLVYFRSDIDPLNKKYIQISAFHNGDTLNDATELKWYSVGNMSFGDDIIGLDFDVILTGVGAGQQMELRVSSTEAVNVRLSFDRVDL